MLEVKINGVPVVTGRLLRLNRSVLDHATVGVDKAAADLLQRSTDLAPIWTGDLIRSARIVKRRRKGKFIKRIVAYGTSHAVFAHEIVASDGALGVSAGGSRLFGIGVLTARKPHTEDGPPGGKFLSRPFKSRFRLYEKFVRDEMLRAIKRVARG